MMVSVKRQLSTDLTDGAGVKRAAVNPEPKKAGPGVGVDCGKERTKRSGESDEPSQRHVGDQLKGITVCFIGKTMRSERLLYGLCARFGASVRCSLSKKVQLSVVGSDKEGTKAEEKAIGMGIHVVTESYFFQHWIVRLTLESSKTFQVDERTSALFDGREDLVAGAQCEDDDQRVTTTLDILQFEEIYGQLLPQLLRDIWTEFPNGIRVNNSKVAISGCHGLMDRETLSHEFWSTYNCIPIGLEELPLGCWVMERGTQAVAFLDISSGTIHRFKHLTEVFDQTFRAADKGFGDMLDDHLFKLTSTELGSMEALLSELTERKRLDCELEYDQ